MKILISMIVIAITANKVSAAGIAGTLEYSPRLTQYNQVPTDTTLSLLMNINLVSYNNKQVDSFLTVLPANYIKLKIVGGGRPRYADALLVLYPNNVTVHIIVRNFSHMNPKSNVLQWDINLFKMENIDHIEIHAGPVCVKGCS